MKGLLAVVALVAVALLVVIFVPSTKISGDDVLKRADATPEAALFNAMYPSSVFSVEEKGCVADFIGSYVKDISAPLMARNRDLTCSKDDKDWLVTYSATGITDTSTLYVGVKSDGTVIDAAFISPYDDIYILNYSFGTLMPVLEKILNKSEIVALDGWASFYDGETKYLLFMMPHDTYTAVALYIEKTPEYKVPTNETLRSEVAAAHEKFEAGGKKISGIMRASFLGDFNATTHYLYFPEPE